MRSALAGVALLLAAAAIGWTVSAAPEGTRAAVGVLRDERIAVVGGIQATGSTLWVLHPDGTLDRSFGRNGRLVLSPT